MARTRATDIWWCWASAATQLTSSKNKPRKKLTERPSFRLCKVLVINLPPLLVVHKTQAKGTRILNCRIPHNLRLVSFMDHRAQGRLPSLRVLPDQLVEVYDSRDPILELSLRHAADLCDLDRRRHDSNCFPDCAAGDHAWAVCAALLESRSACLIDADKSRCLLALLTADCGITEPAC